MASIDKNIECAIKDELATKFNVLLGEFVRKLMTTFPDNKFQLKVIYNKLLVPIATMPCMPIEQFYVVIAPLTELITSKSDAFFTDEAAQLSMFAGVDMRKNWEASPLTTREAIWSYMNALLQLAQSYDSVAATSASSFSYVTRKMTQEFKSKNNNRTPTDEDDISEYAMQLCDGLGIDLGDIANTDLHELTKQMKDVDLSSIVGRRVSKQEMKRMTASVITQLQKLQARHRRRAKLL